MQLSIITLLAAATATVSAGPATIPRSEDPDIDDVRAQAKVFKQAYDYAVSGGGDLEKRQSVCPYDRCLDDCSRPSICFGAGCDMWPFGCAMGCCVACGC